MQMNWIFEFIRVFITNANNQAVFSYLIGFSWNYIFAMRIVENPSEVLGFRNESVLAIVGK